MRIDSSKERRLIFIINYVVLVGSCIYGLNTLPVEYLIGKTLTMMGLIISFLCLLFIILIYYSCSKKYNELITTGPYGYVRHPFYLSIIISNYGISLMYLSIYSIFVSTLLLLPWWYLARKEEEELIHHWGERYVQYKENVPMFLPMKIRKKNRLKHNH